MPQIEKVLTRVSQVGAQRTDVRLSEKIQTLPSLPDGRSRMYFVDYEFSDFRTLQVSLTV